MTAKSVYEKVCDHFGIQTGSIPDRENLVTALKQTLNEEEVKFYLLTPIFGSIAKEKLDRKAKRKRILTLI